MVAAWEIHQQHRDAHLVKGYEMKFFLRPCVAPEARRKLAGGKLRAAPGKQPGTIAPRQGRWKMVNPDDRWNTG
jgi:hypothetical protein